MPIFRVKSVKIYTGQKNLHGHVRGVRDKYEVCARADIEQIQRLSEKAEAGKVHIE